MLDASTHPDSGAYAPSSGLPRLDGRLTSATAKNGTTSVQNLAYGYDVNDRITRIINGVDASMTQDFGYDVLSRLTGISSPAYSQTLAYDANSNRTSYRWHTPTSAVGWDEIPAYIRPEDAGIPLRSIPAYELVP